MNKLIVLIANNCQRRKIVTDEYIGQVDATIKTLETSLPFGMGIDKGCKIDVANSGNHQVVILFDFHHKNERGIFTKWSTHKLIAKPCFAGFSIKIANARQYGIEDELIERFRDALSRKML